MCIIIRQKYDGAVGGENRNCIPECDAYHKMLL